MKSKDAAYGQIILPALLQRTEARPYYHIMFIDSDPDSKSLGLLPTSSSSSPCPHNESDRLYNDWPFPLTFFVMLRLRVLSFIAAVLLLLSEGTVAMTNQSWRISSWCIRHFLHVQHQFPVKFSDTIVWLLYPFVIADMTTQPLQVTFSASWWYITYTKHVTYQSDFFVLHLFANTVCLFHLHQADGYWQDGLF